MIGKTVGHYEILELLGRGGMGEVYRARDNKLNRIVALKFLPHGKIGVGPERVRFLREAQTASALDHPNIGTIFDIQESGEGQTYIVMAYYEGSSLADRLESGALPVEEAIDIASQIASGLAAAHAKQILHRDIKPANILVNTESRVKIVDFGLAKDLGATALTMGDQLLGTAAYMSPEQAQGEAADERSDVWALGAVLFEMLAGRRPFEGESAQAMLYQVVNESAPDLEELRPGIPAELVATVKKALAKNPDDRFASADEFRRTLRVQSNERTVPSRREIGIVAAVLVVAIAGIAAWIGSRIVGESTDEAERRSELLVEARALIGDGRDFDAFQLLENSGLDIEADPALHALYVECSLIARIESDPPGATVSYRSYLSADGEAVHLGTTPLDGQRLPVGNLRVHFELNGHEPRELAANAWRGLIQAKLIPKQEAREGMQFIPAGTTELGDSGPVTLPAFWMDTFELSNAEYQEFVDAGGYENEEFWTHPFVREERALSWEEAMQLLVDATGRPGPSSWELGRHPADQDSHPVGGISWYEAAAYLEFAGKQMPTIYHWRRAANPGVEGEILLVSNLESDAPAPVGSFAGLSSFGNFDMAGNVQEWCWNESRGRRYALGGAWSDPPYAFNPSQAKTLDPFSRDATLGIRGMLTTEPVADVAFAALRNPVIDFTDAQPVDDTTFAAIVESYAYDPFPLDARVEERSEEAHWTKEKVSFRASYGNERVPAYLFLPRSAEPPYQTVIYFPGGAAEHISDSERLSNLRYWDFVVQSGRAVLYPVYENMYERQQKLEARGPHTRSGNVRHWSQDIRRSIDYLKTRDDIDDENIAYYSLSLGSTYAPIFLALEPRLRCSVLLAGGLFQYPWPADAKPLNFVSRVRVPTLMVNGKYDFGLPIETSVRPMLAKLDLAEEDKKLFLFDGDHIPRANEIVRVTLDWFDRYLGDPQRTQP